MATNKTKKAKFQEEKRKVSSKEKVEEATIVETKPLTDEDLLLGKETESVKVGIINYLAVEKEYLVKIEANQRQIKANGREIGTFLGQDLQARRDLQRGCKKVQIKDYRQRLLYEIEVIK